MQKAKHLINPQVYKGPTSIGPHQFFNFKSWRNKSVLRILIFPLKSGYLATLIFFFRNFSIEQIFLRGHFKIYEILKFK